jgi:DNA-binding MarR family transcriptional regulator
VLGQLVRRLRSENRLPLARGAVLGRLDHEGPRSVSELACAERVRPQSMAQAVAGLERDGLIARHPDPHDGRRAVVELTAQGRSTLETDRMLREGWLAEAIVEHLTPGEQSALMDAAALLRRLAES